jgi:hypothetical protein
MECEHENTTVTEVAKSGTSGEVTTDQELCLDCKEIVEPEQIDYFKDER